MANAKRSEHGNDVATRLYAWLGKWGDQLPMQARLEFRSAVEQEPATDQHPEVAGSCRRGERTHDDSGKPFDHEYDPHSKICIWCGKGAAPPPPQAFDHAPQSRIETVACAIHGSHQLNVDEKGHYARPDCEMFNAQPSVEP